MTCPVCGTPTIPAARFCFACGAQLAQVGHVPPDVETDRRVVTVLFGDLSDFTSWAEDLDPERVGVVTDRVLASLAAIVGDFGGHVDKLTGDGIMAVFGAPTAHEDDAERAVRAAERMQSVVRRLVEQESGGGQRLGLRVGLNTGEVVAGVQAHLSYTVIGDAVNTAARLSDAAGVGAVYAGRDTATSTLATASWRALAPLRLKGKREPVMAYELVGLRPPGATRLGLGDEAPFLGREAEFGLLLGRLLDVADRQASRTVLVTGDAGVGKTRLVQELARFCGELPGARVLWGRCAPYGEGRDLAAVAEMVRTACGIGETDSADTARERVRRAVGRLEHPAYTGPVPSAVGEQLLALLGLAEPDGGPREGATPGTPTGGDTVRQAVAALFSALAADSPLMLVVDDLHWATPNMLRGMLDVARQVTGTVLLLAVGRPEMLERLPAADGDQAWWSPLSSAELLPLLPLEDAAAERLLRAYLGAGPEGLDPGVRDALLDRAQGNPFFLAELLHLLVDRGVLERDGEHWRLTTELPEELLPAGVQAVLAARIDGLDGPAKGVLRDASVLGLQVDLGGLEAVGRASGHGHPDVVAAALTTLLERRLLEADSDAGGFRFAHALVRDVAYAGLAKAERARRHAAAAAHGAAAPADRPGEVDLMTASQGERAVRLATEMGLPPTDPAWRGRGIAVAALARLGRAALARDDNTVAEHLLGRALRLGRPSADAPAPLAGLEQVRVAHAAALAALHRLDDADAELTSALDGGDEGLRAAALVVLGDVRRKRGDSGGAVQALVSALAAAGAAGDDRTAGEALRQLGLLDYFDGRLRAAEARFQEAHALAVQVGDARGAGWALQHLAWSATTRGDYARADEALEQAAEVFTRLEDTGGLSWVAGTEGFVRLLEGRLTEARELAGSLLPLGVATGERWGVAALLTIDALAAGELGDTAVATEQAEAARDRFAEVGDVWGQAMALVALGNAARRSDDLDRAVAVLEDAVALSLQARNPLVTSLALVALGHTHLDRGDLVGAQDAVERVQSVLGGLEIEPSAVLGAKVLFAQVLRRRGRPAEALLELDDALAAATRPALLFPFRQALAHRAGTLLDLGRPAEALETARRAMAAQSEDPRSAVLALRAHGAALQACGEPDLALASLREALALARSTGQRAEAAVTERLLAAAGSTP